MDKFNILVCPGDNAGSGKYRCIDPHINLQQNHSDKFFVDINYNVNFEDFEYLKKFDAIFLHRSPQHNYPNAVNILTNLRKLGIKIIVDTDDYWHLDPSHSMYEQVKKEGIPEILIKCMKLADMVTVPTPILAAEVKNINPNVVVLPNALDSKEEQFKSKPTPSDKLRIGWLGGSSHIKDIELLKGFGNLGEDYKDKIQMVLCGFDTRGSVRELNEQKQVVERPMKATETVWFLYELFFTDSYRALADYPDYIKFLINYKEDSNFDDSKMPYKRVWTKSINQYGRNYNLFDVSLAPLKENKFNLFKSQLKVIEAGFHKKALIAQNYGPYTIDLVNAILPGGGINPNGNCLLVENSKNHKQWLQHAKRLVDNPDLVKMLGENLYNTVKDKYDITNVTNDRAEAYYKLLTKTN